MARLEPPLNKEVTPRSSPCTLHTTTMKSSRGMTRVKHIHVQWHPNEIRSQAPLSLSLGGSHERTTNTPLQGGIFSPDESPSRFLYLFVCAKEPGRGVTYETKPIVCRQFSPCVLLARGVPQPGETSGACGAVIAFLSAHHPLLLAESGVHFLSSES